MTKGETSTEYAFCTSLAVFKYAWLKGMMPQCFFFSCCTYQVKRHVEESQS